MRQLEQVELDQISGGLDFDWKGIPVGLAAGLLGAGVQWYRGAGWFSSQALLWGVGGAVVGAAGYYGVQAAINYFGSGE